jgi:hypothetical protein
VHRKSYAPVRELLGMVIPGMSGDQGGAGMES